jgi:hypothetical protein
MEKRRFVYLTIPKRHVNIIAKVTKILESIDGLIGEQENDCYIGDNLNKTKTINLGILVGESFIPEVINKLAPINKVIYSVRM